MDATIYYTKLFDLYYKLLTEKQCEYFRYYYFENLTLEEISENEGVSRANVSKEINKVKDLLDDYENKIHLLKYRDGLLKEFKNDKEVLSRIQKYDKILM